MLGSRPFVDCEALHAAAERVWWSLGEADWLEAFRAHPRIGAAQVRERWSRAEQSGVAGASTDVLEALARLNHDYEERFGFVFLVCASGLSAEQMLGALRSRSRRTRPEEVRSAAQEHVKITALRLGGIADEHENADER